MERKPEIVVDPAYPQLTGFVASLPACHAKSEQVLYNRRNLVQKYTVEGIELVVKQFATPHLLNRIVYSALRKSKAERSMTMARRLSALGIATPEAVAYVNTYRRGLYRTGYSVTRYMDCDLVSRFGELDAEAQHRLVLDLADFTAHMHRSGFVHNDFHEGNIFFRREGEAFRFCVIDINRGRFVRPTRLRCIKDLILMRFTPELFSLFLRRYTALMGWNYDYFHGEVLRRRALRSFDKDRLRPFVRRLLGMRKYKKMLEEE